ncbi:hypothetical protein IC757_03075 [Wenzhouxiangella sp. AB-CW3]|uniref:HzsA-related protein n=1 Tax=Wenzhouxiangella sp. AB-CW3 TaxID=2771012 RepID=UPI00168AA2E2|nr:hypothetical protein [Wenzhouxiangella sp. AB-CW3]QOC23157.1 hypothetical protein IC757_03075 [Wenzhouxiangella sp. AB-CW3]
MRLVPVLVLVFLVAGELASAAVDYDIVYVRQARFGDEINTVWPEVGRPGRIDPGADLILRRPDGSEEVLVECDVCAVTDPMVSFDAQWVYYSLFHDVSPEALNTQRRHLSYQGADIFRIHLETREIEQLTFGEFTPNTGSGQWDENNPVDPPSGYNRLGYGVLNLGPMPLPGGRLVFTSSRNGFIPTRPFSSPTLQMFVMDIDGENVEAIAPMTLGSVLHPTILRDGRLMFSSYESQGLRDRRVWGVWAIKPDGRQWEPLVSAMSSPDAFHFMTQISNGDIVVEAYYNLNNNGFGALYGFPASPPPGEPAFHSWDPEANPEIDVTSPGGSATTFRMSYTPNGYYAVTPMTHHFDNAAPEGDDGERVGKFTHPSAAPNNDLLVAWTPGPANDLNRPTRYPYYDSGIYLIPGSEPVWDPDDMVTLVEDENFNAAWPRAVVPYSAIHGVDEPEELDWLPNDGSEHPELPAGTPHGLVGTSSMYKRETFPGAGSNAFDGLDPFNTSSNRNHRNRRWSNWVYQGADAGRYDDSDIWAVRVLAMEGIPERRYGPDAHRTNGFYNHANERLRILGEIPVRNVDSDGQPIIDAEGNPDTSFLAKLPADTPFTFQTLDRNGMVLNMAQTWHQVRPGEMRADCGGCHAHSQMPLEFEGTAASQPDYEVPDLTAGTTLVSRNEQGEPNLVEVIEKLVDVEFYRDIRPILQDHCVQCHNADELAGNLDLADTDIIDGCNWNDPSLPGDYRRLAADECADFGYPPVISTGSWRQTNASRYIRKFQSRRSLLVWKVFGERLDGWSNDDHPTESVAGDPDTLPPGASPNDADIDFTGTIMPPPDSGVSPLSMEQKMTIARWVDLGAPIDLAAQHGMNPKLGWFMDAERPTLTISSPRHNLVPQPVDAIRFGMADANSGLDHDSLSVTASFSVRGRGAGTELADLVESAGDGRYFIDLPDGLPGSLYNARVHVEVADQQGNITRVSRRFHTTPSGDIFSDRFQ